MPVKNTATHYGAVTKLLHWTIALLIIGMLILGHVMGDFEQPLRGQLYGIHKSIGLLIGGLMFVRLLWRFGNITPALPASLPNWQKLAAKINHWSLYIALILMPVSGTLMSAAAGYPPKFFGLFTVAPPIAKSKAVSSFFGDVHEILGWVIVALLTLHLLAVIKHLFINKDNVVKRMLPFTK